MQFLVILVIILLKTTDNSLVNKTNLQNHKKSFSFHIKSTGMCGTSLSYLIDGEKLIIEGSGEMTSYDYNNRPPWYPNRTEITTIELPEEITFIGSYAFSDLSNLRKFKIPPKVTIISIYIFSKCSSLSSIEIHDDVESIMNCAFENCISLQHFRIPPKVTIISNDLFSNCSSLSSIEIHDEVT